MVVANERGFHPIDVESVEWVQTTPPPGTTPEERDGLVGALQGSMRKDLVMADDDGRFAVSLIRFPPNFTFPLHRHSESEFSYIVRGSAVFNGVEVTPGNALWVDANTTYGPEAAGPDGCDFIIMRRAQSSTEIVS